MEDSIYWIQWLPGQERLVFTTGQSILDQRTSTSAAPFRVEQGSYKLFSVGTNGGGLRRLFEDDDVDAHRAQPTLSHDGSYVALVAGGETTLRVMILATEAPRTTALSPAKTSSHPSWLPPPSPDNSAARLCPVVVVYPLD